MNSPQILQQVGAIDLSGPLGWLRDAPLFTDKIAIDAIYDAVVRPTFHDGTVVINVNEATKNSVESNLAFGATLGINKLLSSIFKAEGSVSAGRKRGEDKTKGEGQQITFHPIKTPQRQLEQLAIFYTFQHADRIMYAHKDLANPTWYDDSWIQKTPRALVFLELPSGARIIPLAAEFSNNKIVTIFDKMKPRNGGQLPKYPEPTNAPDAQALLKERKAYWSWFNENFNATDAIVAVEEAASANGRIRWIDYRLPIDNLGQTLHLHVSANGEYDTGVLAYNFIKRGFKHGIRLVGTMKREPDMNVLAIYDR